MDRCSQIHTLLTRSEAATEELATRARAAGALGNLDHAVWSAEFHGAVRDWLNYRFRAR